MKNTIQKNKLEGSNLVDWIVKTPEDETLQAKLSFNQLTSKTSFTTVFGRLCFLTKYKKINPKLISQELLTADTETGWTPFHYLAEQGQLAEFKNWLGEKGNLVNKENLTIQTFSNACLNKERIGSNAFTIAFSVANKHPEQIDWLIQEGLITAEILKTSRAEYDYSHKDVKTYITLKDDLEELPKELKVKIMQSVIKEKLKNKTPEKSQP
jgi:hypothetical protein